MTEHDKLTESGAAAAGTTALEAGASTPPVEQSPEPEGTAAPSRSGDLTRDPYGNPKPGRERP